MPGSSEEVLAVHPLIAGWVADRVLSVVGNAGISLASPVAVRISAG